MKTMGQILDGQDPARGLTDLATGLAVPRASIERDFLEMGDRLVACAQLFGEMSSAYEDMPKALDGDDYHAAVELLQEVSALAARIVVDNRDTSVFLEEMSVIVRGAERAAEAMPDFVRTIRSVASVARITAAGLRTGERDLTDFTLNMKSSAETIAGAVHGFSAVLARMRDSVQEAAVLNAPLAERNAALLERIETELASAFEAMDKQRSWAAEQAADHTARSARIGAGLSNAVGALQVGDSTRQRVEHVEQALTLVASADEHITVQAGAVLLSEQLVDAIGAFEGEVDILATSLSELLKEAVDMLESIARDTETILSAGGSAFGTLRRSIDRIRRMFEDYRRDSAVLALTIGNLVERVEEMLAYLDTFDAIGKDIELVSLNAAIKSRTLGDEGRAFRKVAEELRALARDMAPAVERVNGHLSKSGDSLRRYLDTGASNGAGADAARREAVAAAERRIDGVAARLQDRASFISETGPQAVTLLQKASALVTDRRDRCAAWRKGAAELAGIGAGHSHDACIEGNAEDLLASIFGLYTMQAERDVHFRLFSAPHGWTAPAEPNAGEAALGDIFF